MVMFVFQLLVCQIANRSMLQIVANQVLIIIQQVMEQISSLSSQLLPRNLKNTTTTTKVGKTTSFYSNIFEISLKKGTPSIYQFSYEVSPELPADSIGLKQKIISNVYVQLKKLIGMVCYKGDMLWGKTSLTKAESLISQFQRETQVYKFQILVKQVKELSLPTFIKENPENITAICQFLNINTKNMLRDNKMIELTSGDYYDKQIINENQVKQHGFNVWRGFKVTIMPYNSKLFLQVDPCSRVLRQESFLVTIQRQKKNNLPLEEMSFKYKDEPVLIKFGNLKIYRIDGIEFKMSPKNTFYYAVEGKQITYIEYYQKKYGYKIQRENQPLVRIKNDNKFKTFKGKSNEGEGKEKQNQKQKEKDCYIYLVPEMIVLTGLSEQQKSNHRIMKSLDPYTKLHPQDRMDQTKKILQKLKKSPELMYEISQEPWKLNGYKFDDPQIFLGKNKTFIKNGKINLRSKILDPHNFKNFIFCYSVGKDPKFDRQDADFAIDQIITASKTFEIKVSEPIWVQINNPEKFKSWQTTLQGQRQKQNENSRSQIIIFFLKPNEQKLYSELKKYASNLYNCHSQMVRRRSLAPNTKGVLSFASKIVLQMNSKVGCPLWYVTNVHQFWKNNSVAIAGLASSGGKNGSTIGIVATTKQDFTSYFCQCKKIQSRDKLSAALFEGIYLSWLQNYFRKNKKLPKVLIIYREGLNDIQAKYQFEFQVQGLLEAIKTAGTKTKTENYDPRISYILVNKKPHSRIYSKSNEGKNSTYSNPQSGSIIFQDLATNRYKEFHLASVEVNQGSCTPVSFKVGYEKHEIPLDAIAEITYNQCYCYFNWDGPVRVPASLQYANKLSKLYSEVGQDLAIAKGSQLKLTPFFL